MQEMSKQGVTLEESSFDETLTDQQKLADELGADAGAYAAAKKVVKAFEDRRKILIAKATEGVDASEEVVIHGEKFSVKVGEASVKRTVTNKKAIYEALGNDNFVALASFGLGDLDKYLNPAQVAEAITKARTGSRKVTVGMKGAL